MDIAKQIVDQRILGLIKENPGIFTESEEKNISKAFLMLGVSAYLDLDIPDTLQYITEGRNDGGFDAAYIVDGADMQLNVILFQSKYTRNLDSDTNFPANAVEKAVNTVKCVFDPSAHMVLNEQSQTKVNEIRSLILDGHIPYVTFVMLNNGLKWDETGDSYIKNTFGNQPQVKFVHYNHTDIVKYVTSPKKINTQLTLSGAAIQENFNYKRVILGKIPVTEIFALFEQYGDSLLEKNIRRYLGKNAVNNGIVETLLDSQKKQNFFFYNNGLTLVCEKFAYNGLQQSNWIVKLDSLQIINGGQTCKTIYQTIKENPALDFSQIFVLVRIYELSDDEQTIRDITYATNSQNPVDLRDLKANDEKQTLLEKGAAELGFTYRRKRDYSTAINAIPSTVAAESILSVWRNKPHIARYRKNDLFGSYFNEIFGNVNAAQMIVAVQIFRYCDAVRKHHSGEPNCDAIRPFETHFMSNIVGKLLLEQKQIEYKNIDHKNFYDILSFFDENKQNLITLGETLLYKMLSEYFQKEAINELDGRTIATAFRRYDLLERYITNPTWWNSHK